MNKRYRDAVFVQDPGACNPSGIVYSMIEAFREIRAEGGDTKALKGDPAVRLMAHQLAFLCGVGEIDADLTLYGKLMNECRLKANLA